MDTTPLLESEQAMEPFNNQKTLKPLILMLSILAMLVGWAGWRSVRSNTSTAVSRQTKIKAVRKIIVGKDITLPGCPGGTVIVCVNHCDNSWENCPSGEFFCPLPSCAAHEPIVSHQSCSTACRNYFSYSAVQTGTYLNGHAFDFCSANKGNEGYRGGYFLSTSGNVCTVPWGGGEHGEGSFKCLCEYHTNRLAQKASVHNQKNCYHLCQNYPIQTGTYTDGRPFYACAANYNNEGFRGGYQLSGSGHCTVPHGGGEKAAHSFKCICKGYTYHV